MGSGLHSAWLLRCMISALRRSATLWRAASLLARFATRSETPCNHGPRESGLRMDRAFLASTRKTACAASWASCRSPRMSRQTRSTIGPCRWTKMVKAASADSPVRERNSRNSSASERSAVESGFQRVWTAPGAACGPLVTFVRNPLAVGLIYTLVLSREAYHFRILGICSRCGCNRCGCNVSVDPVGYN